MSTRMRHRAGIQSIEVGAPLLSALAAAVGPLTLTALSQATGMPPSKAHKYLASFVRTGLVEQRSANGRYALGPLAVECGFAALRRIEVVEVAQDTLDGLRDELDLTASLTIWGNQGPTIVRGARNRQPVALVVQLGLVLPLLTSSNGQIFAAHFSRRLTQDMIRKEMRGRSTAAARAGLRGAADVERMLEAVRRQGFAVANETVQPGVVGVSVPVFDHSGELVAALTLVGAAGAIRTNAKSRAVTALKSAAEALSRRLGHPGNGRETPHLAPEA